MRANEKKFQSFIGKMFVPFRNSLRFLSDFLEKLLGFLSHLTASHGVDHAVTGDVQEPRFRLFWNAFRWPSLQRCDERVAERVFRAGDVARSRREISDQSSIRIPRHGFNCSVGRRFIHAGFAGATPNPSIGRTSMEANPAAGWRAAHSNAASRFGTSMMPNPARNSFVSA